MIDYYGRWTPEQNYREYPHSKWCDCDYLANAIMQEGYRPKTSLENLVWMIFAHFETNNECEDEPYDDSLSGWLSFVRDSGGFGEFDYYC